MRTDFGLRNCGIFLFSISVCCLTSPVAADDLDNIHTAKAVWDVTTGDEKNFLDKMALIKQTAVGLEKHGIKPDFIIVLRGKAAKFITKSLKGTKFERHIVPNMDKAQNALSDLRQSGTQVEICAIAMSQAKITHDNVQPFAAVQQNVLENLIVLQNKGYAYMPVH